MKQEIYRSETLGDIPLSFMGRHLLQNLREAINEYANASLRRNGGIPFSQVVYSAEDWKPVSVARGKLAQYMSKLEQRCERPRAYESKDNDSPRVRVHHVNSMEDVFKFIAGYEAGEQPPETPQPPESTELKAEVGETADPPPVNIHLPDIPAGYALHMVGSILTIEPHEPKPQDSAEPPKSNSNINKDALYSLLNEYRDALLYQCEQYRATNGVENIQNQGRVDRARMALVNAYESVAT